MDRCVIMPIFNSTGEHGRVPELIGPKVSGQVMQTPAQFDQNEGGLFNGLDISKWRKTQKKIPDEPQPKSNLSRGDYEAFRNMSFYDLKNGFKTYNLTGDYRKNNMLLYEDLVRSFEYRDEVAEFALKRLIEDTDRPIYLMPREKAEKMDCVAYEFRGVNEKYIALSDELDDPLKVLYALSHEVAGTKYEDHSGNEKEVTKAGEILMAKYLDEAKRCLNKQFYFQ